MMSTTIAALIPAKRFILLIKSKAITICLLSNCLCRFNNLSSLLILHHDVFCFAYSLSIPPNYFFKSTCALLGTTVTVPL